MSRIFFFIFLSFLSCFRFLWVLVSIHQLELTGKNGVDTMLPTEDDFNALEAVANKLKAALLEVNRLNNEFVEALDEFNSFIDCDDQPRITYEFDDINAYEMPDGTKGTILIADVLCNVDRALEAASLVFDDGTGQLTGNPDYDYATPSRF